MTSTELTQSTPSALTDIWNNIIRNHKKTIYDAKQKKNVTTYPYYDQVVSMPVAPAATEHSPVGTGIFTIDYEDIAFGVTLGEDEAQRKEYAAIEYLIRNNYDMAIKPCEDAVKNILNEFHPKFLEYIGDRIIINIKNFSKTTNIPEYSSLYVDKFTRTDGIIAQFDENTMIDVKSMTWLCREGHKYTYPPGLFIYDQGKQPTRSRKCRHEGCTADLVQEVTEERKMVDYIFLQIQERNDKVKEGKLPKTIDVKITGIEMIQRFLAVMDPGAYVIINGIIRLVTGAKKINAPIYIEASSIEIINDENVIEDIPEIEELIAQPIAKNRINEHFAKLVRSICPSLEGMEWIKTAALLLLVGSNPKRREDGSRQRGELMVLVVSSPARGKTDTLKFVSMIRPRSIYTQGRGSTAVGLTAGVGPSEMSIDATGGRSKSKNNRILFGAIALSHGGICCIDELEKRNPKDFQDISHTMDDWQNITLDKMGIHEKLLAYCGQMHACNPVTNAGLYDPLTPIADQVNFAEWLLSRYDLIMTVPDDNSPAGRERFLDHVAKTYATITLEKEYLSDRGKKKIAQDADNFPMPYLRHEVKFLRENYNPVISPKSKAWVVMMKFYHTYRTKNQVDRLDAENRMKYQTNGKNMFIPLLDNRKLNTLIRLAEASARARRRNEVIVDDVILAIKLVKMTINVIAPNNNANINSKTVNTLATRIMKKSDLTIQKRFAEERRRREHFFNKFKNFLISQTFTACDQCRGTGIMREGGMQGDCGSCDGSGGGFSDVSYNTMMYSSDILKKDGFTNADIEEHIQLCVQSNIISDTGDNMYKIMINLRNKNLTDQLKKQLSFEMDEEDLNEEPKDEAEEELTEEEDQEMDKIINADLDSTGFPGGA